VQGVSPVLETAFTDGGLIDEAGFVRVVDHVLETGVRSVMFPGFASEFHKLTDVERHRLIELVLQRTATAPGVTAVISVPLHATVPAVAEARWAVDGGAGALNLLPPHFLGPSAESVRAHVLAVLEAAFPVPVVLQHAPAQTGSALDAAAIAGLADAAPNLVQVKVESAPPGTFIAALAAGEPALSSVVGYAGLQLPDALRRGAVGVQPGSSFVELYQAFWQLWDSDRPAALELHRRMLPYLSYWMQSVELIIAAEKLVSWRRGLLDSAHCRAPARSLDEQERTMVEDFLTEFSDLLPRVGR
jgi:4-hydroxy-tetrahydrodipicolinate synthase